MALTNVAPAFPNAQISDDAPMPSITSTVVNPSATIPYAPRPGTPTETSAPPQASNGTQVIKAERAVTGPYAIGGMILVFTGFMFCFMGRRTYNPALFLSGFYTFGKIQLRTYLLTSRSGIIALVSLDIIQRNVHQFGQYADWIYLLVCIPVAVIGGLLCRCVYRIGCIAGGAILGFVWAIAILFTGIGANLSPDGHMIFMLVCSAAGAAAVFIIEHLTIILGTANGGGLSIVAGIDCFARTGFVEVLARCIDGNPPASGEIPGLAWGLLASAIVLAMAGWFIQTRPKPPAEPSVWNPAYWLFGAQRPPPTPPTWFTIPPNTANTPVPRAAEPFSWSKTLNPFEWKW
ncbi:hypothetical protein HK101_003510 [Irineochytrium annulatum]|nr:hypothetical protein HK101_003510 [Irineochytrium annulatum]